MIAIYGKELRSAFNSMTGYVFTAVVVFFLSVTYRSINLVAGFPYFAYALSGTSLVFVLAVPIITMRSMAEERRYKTDQMLLTAPVTVTAVVLGKYLAMVTVFAVPLGISCLYPIVIRLCGGGGSYLIDYSAVFAFLCLGLLMVAIGMFISSLTESQVIAAVSSMGALLALLLWPDLVMLVPETKGASLIGFFVLLALALALIYRLTRGRIITGVTGFVFVCGLLALYFLNGPLMAAALRKTLAVFSVPKVLANFTAYYTFDVRGVVLLLSVAALFVFLTIQSVQKRRWS